MTTNTTQQSLRRPWTSWSDWAIVVLGVYLALSPLWTAGAPLTWFIVLGAGIAIVGLWALSLIANRTAEWIVIVLGAFTFATPWIMGFAGSAFPAWTAWILGGLVAVLGVVTLGRES